MSSRQLLAMNAPPAVIAAAMQGEQARAGKSTRAEQYLARQDAAGQPFDMTTYQELVAQEDPNRLPLSDVATISDFQQHYPLLSSELMKLQSEGKEALERGLRQRGISPDSPLGKALLDPAMFPQGLGEWLMGRPSGGTRGKPIGLPLPRVPAMPF